MMRFQNINKTWLGLLVVIFVVKNLLIAGIGTPWYGEDEPSHFGYIEALARTGDWYVFEENFASVEMRMAHRWWDVAEDRQAVVVKLGDGKMKAYRELASEHKNATAYQPPLFYWLMARIYRVWPINMVSMLYLLRAVNILAGIGLVLTTYVIVKRVLREEWQRLAVVAGVVFLPLLSLLSATVTVQVWVFWLYAVLIWALLYAQDRPVAGYGLTIPLCAAGLLSQQALYAMPVIAWGFIWWDVYRRRLNFRAAAAVSLGLVLVVGLIAPQLWRRHMETNYTVSRGTIELRRYDWLHYLPGEWKRLQDEVVGGFWDQTRSMIPYYASDRGKRMMEVLLVVAGISLVYALIGTGERKKWDRQRRRFLEIGLVMGGVLVGGHLVIDHLQIKYSGQEYLKARYWYPLLPIIISGIVAGMVRVSRSRVGQRGLVLIFISLVVFLQMTAISWLALTIGNR